MLAAFAPSGGSFVMGGSLGFRLRLHPRLYNRRRSAAGLGILARPAHRASTGDLVMLARYSAIPEKRRAVEDRADAEVRPYRIICEIQ